MESKSGQAQTAPGNQITEGVIWKQLLLFFFPIVFGTFFQQLYNTADAIVVGKFVGKEALAAVGGASGTFMNLLVGFFVGLASGGTVIISQYYGGKRRTHLERSVHTAMMLSLVGGAAVMVIGLIGSGPVLRLLQTPAEVYDIALVYMRVYFLGIIPSLVYNMGSGILRAVGDSRRPMLFLILCCIVNIVLDVLFVAVFRMGVFGAALATALSQLVSAVLVTVTLMRAREDYRLDLRRLRLDKGILKRIVSIGLPAGIQSSMFSLSNLLIQSSVNSFGTAVMAGWTATGKIDAVYWMVLDAIGVAITTFVGQNFGAGKFDRIRGCVRSGFAISIISTALIVGALYVAGPLIFPLFTDDAEVLQLGVSYLKFMILGYGLHICNVVLPGAMRGTGESFLPTVVTAAGICGTRILWILFILPMRRDMIFLIWSYPISWAITSLMFIWYYTRAPWLARRKREVGFALTEKEEASLTRRHRGRAA